MIKLALLHNSYIIRGGEDVVFEAELSLMKKNNTKVVDIVVSNNSISNNLNVALRSSYNTNSRQAIYEKIINHKITIAHVHNFFPLFTPSIYDACIEADIPVVQTLHNYRTICPGALLMRDGKLCETCINHSPYHAVLHKCYRDSRVGSFVVANMVAYHRKHKTWQTKVDRFIALTHFAKSKFIEAGFPEDKIRVKPNFIEDPFEGDEILPAKLDKALFVGRFSQEKGVSVLLGAWKSIQYPLCLAGDGPTFDANKKKSMNNNAHFLGSQTSEQVHDLMSQTRFLIMPSVCNETFGMVLIEAFAHAVPVICSRLGGMAEIVEDQVTGLHFEAGNADDLAYKVKWMIAHPAECEQMGQNARAEYLNKYTPEINYQQLMSIYKEAIDEC